MFFSNKYAWYLIEAQLPSRVPKIQAQLKTKNSQNIKNSIPLSVTFKGRLFEVVRLGQGETPLEVHLVVDDDIVTDELVAIKRISRYQACYWMWHRIVFMHTVLSAKLRRRMGFSEQVRRSLYDAYRLISSFRYHYPAPAYEEWLSRYWPLQPTHLQAITSFQKQQSSATVVEVIIDARGASPQAIENTITSLKSQIGFTLVPHIWKSLASRPQIAHTAATVLYLHAGCILRPWAVAWFSWQQAQQPEAACIYGDHDHYTEDINTLHTPHFKPDWSLELQRNSAYVGNVLWMQAEAFKKAYEVLEDTVSVYTLLLEVAVQQPQAVIHIPALLWAEPELLTFPKVNHNLLQAHLNRHQVKAEISIDQRGLTRIHYTLPVVLPMVSIIIPTRDLLPMLQPCVESVLKYTQWPNYEIIIVDNQSSCPQTLAYLAQLQQQEPRVRVIAYDKPFNYSAINNHAVEQAAGEIICLLNNDTEVISPDWLNEMVSRLLQPKVGVVGTRLYFTDGRVQHAGDVVGVGGCATHLYGVINADEMGYMHRAVLAQDLSAVTAACLVTHRALYQRLGGLNAQDLTVAFNDVDYCLRIREAGYAVIYTPYAELYHHESVSRGKEDDPIKQARAKAEAEYMRKRWRVIREGDPYYNPNLSAVKPDFTLSKVPAVDWPWVS